MKVYIAGPSSDLDRVDRAIALLAHVEGVELTYDWTKAVRAERERGVTDDALSFEDARRYATLDLRAIRQADLLWLLLPPPGSTSVGAWVELGYALAMGLRIVASGERSSSIFVRGFMRQYASDAAAVDHISGYTRQRRLRPAWTPDNY